MKNLLVLSALKNQYYYSYPKHDYFLKYDEERRNGTPTLIATKVSQGTSWRWYTDADYSCKCMNCNWDYTTKNTYERLTNFDVECPNCGYKHKKENTQITSDSPDVNKIPMYWELKVQQLDKTTVALQIKYDHCYGLSCDSTLDHMEKFIFDLKNNKAEWELWERNDKYTLKERLNIGYIADKDNIAQKSVFAFLLPDYKDDKQVELKEAINTLKAAILDIATKALGRDKASLNICSRNPETMLLHSLLNIAHRVRFWNAPALTFLNTKDCDISSWFTENQLNYNTNHEMETAIEADMKEKHINIYKAYLKYFNIPDTEEMRKRFSFRNIGLYKVLERSYQSNRVVNLLFSSLYNVPGKCSNTTRGYSVYDTKKSAIELILDVFDQNINEILLLSDEFIKETIEEIKNRVVNISKLMPEYKETVKSRSENINKLLTDFASLGVRQSTFEANAKLRAERERKTEIQVIAEILDVPNTPIFRKCYNYDYKLIIQEAYKKYDVKTANEFLKVFADAYTLFKKQGASYTTFSNWNGKFTKCQPRKQSLEELLKTVMKFYDVFHPIYPNIITPAYSEKFVQKEDNYAVDSIIMFEKLNDEFKKKFINTKPKMKDIHDVLCSLSNQQKYSEIIYEIPEDVVNRFEMYCKNSKMKVLKKYSELLATGQRMHNCSASYRNRIDQDHILVVYTNDSGKPLAELEIVNNTIVQAKLVDNKPVKQDEAINKAIFDFAQKTKLSIKTRDIDCEDAELVNNHAA